MNAYNGYLIATCVSVDIARIMAIASFILVSVWAGANFENFLGQPNLTSNPMAWHAILMTAGLFFCMTMGVTLVCSPWEYTFWYRHLHIQTLQVILRVWHIAALATTGIGLSAAVKYCNLHSISHATSLHSWIGIIALSCLYYFTFVEWMKLIFRATKACFHFEIVRLETKIPERLLFAKHCHNYLLGVLSIVSISVAVLTGISEYLDWSSGSCQGKQSLSYLGISSGCKIGNGLGLTVSFSTAATIMAVVFNHSAAAIARWHHAPEPISSSAATNHLSILLEQQEIVDKAVLFEAAIDESLDEESKSI